MESRPAADFLRSCPKTVAARLLAIVDAVAAAPPPRFTGGGMWEAMRGQMSGLYEARVRGPGRRLYRLFCLLDREVAGLDRPTIVVLGGMAKPVDSGFTDAEYARMRELGDEYRRRIPRSLA